jgi:hypothetical protein
MPHTMYLAALILLFLSHTPKAAKLRSWLGPDFFFDGNLPSNRSTGGFASSEDGKIYLFGGFNLDGNTYNSIGPARPYAETCIYI